MKTLLTKTVRRADVELLMYSTDGNFWSTDLDEIERQREYPIPSELVLQGLQVYHKLRR